MFASMDDASISFLEKSSNYYDNQDAINITTNVSQK
jgi:hypothetical protein